MRGLKQGSGFCANCSGLMPKKTKTRKTQPLRGTDILHFGIETAYQTMKPPSLDW